MSGKNKRQVLNPTKFLRPQEQYFSFINEEYVVQQNLMTKGKTFEYIEIQSTDIGDLIYVTAPVKDDDESEEDDEGKISQTEEKGKDKPEESGDKSDKLQNCFLGKVISKDSDSETVKVHYCDWTVLGNIRKIHESIPEKTIIYEDIDRTEKIYIVKRHEEEWEGQSKHYPKDILKYFKNHDTLQRQRNQQGIDTRAKFLSKITTLLVEKYTSITLSKIRDAMNKITEEEENDGNPVNSGTHGMRRTNISLIKECFSDRGQEKESVQEVVNTGPQSQNDQTQEISKTLEEIRNQMTEQHRQMEKRMHLLEEKIQLHKVTRALESPDETQLHAEDSETNINAQEQSSTETATTSTQKKGALGKIPGDGKCCYHVCATFTPLTMNPFYNQLELDDHSTEARSQIISNSHDYRDHLREAEKRKAEGKNEQIDTDVIEEKINETWITQVGENADAFITHVAESTETPSRWGGIVEMSLMAWNTPVRPVIIHADKINKNMNATEISKHIHEAVWPHDQEKTTVIYAVLKKGHYSIGLVKNDNNMKAAFPITEAHDALQSILQYIFKIQTPTLTESMISNIKDKSERLKLIKGAIKHSPTSWKRKKGKKKRKTNEQQQATANPDPKGKPSQPQPQTNHRIVTICGSLDNPKANKNHTSITNAVVIYTDANSEDMNFALRTRAPAIANLIHSYRQRKGHIVLMSTPTNERALREKITDLVNMGLQAKPYLKKKRVTHQPSSRRTANQR